MLTLLSQYEYGLIPLYLSNASNQTSFILCECHVHSYLVPCVGESDPDSFCFSYFNLVPRSLGFSSVGTYFHAASTAPLSSSHDSEQMWTTHHGQTTSTGLLRYQPSCENLQLERTSVYFRHCSDVLPRCGLSPTPASECLNSLGPLLTSRPIGFDQTKFHHNTKQHILLRTL